MKRALTALTLTCLVGCAPVREYSSVENEEVSARMAGLGFAEGIAEFNARAGCELFAVGVGPKIEWNDELAKRGHFGWWDRETGDISLSTHATFDTGLFRVTLLHELGHGLGYQHEDECSIMSATSGSGCDEKTQFDLIEEFLRRVRADHGCIGVGE